MVLVRKDEDLPEGATYLSYLNGGVMWLAGCSLCLLSLDLLCFSLLSGQIVHQPCGLSYMYSFLLLEATLVPHPRTGWPACPGMRRSARTRNSHSERSLSASESQPNPRHSTQEPRVMLSGDWWRTKPSWWRCCSTTSPTGTARFSRYGDVGHSSFCASPVPTPRSSIAVSIPLRNMGSTCRT